LQGSAVHGDVNFPHRGKFTRIFSSLVPPSAEHRGRSKKIRPAHRTALQIVAEFILSKAKEQNPGCADYEHSRSGQIAKSKRGKRYTDGKRWKKII